MLLSPDQSKNASYFFFFFFLNWTLARRFSSRHMAPLIDKDSYPFCRGFLKHARTARSMASVRISRASVPPRISFGFVTQSFLTRYYQIERCEQQAQVTHDLFTITFCSRSSALRIRMVPGEYLIAMGIFWGGA